jgi:hypothetical protein
MMGTVVPETCWASNKICNKNRLLHLVGILFPYINEDARSKPHQTLKSVFLYLSPSIPVPQNYLKILQNPSYNSSVTLSF